MNDVVTFGEEIKSFISLKKLVKIKAENWK